METIISEGEAEISSSHETTNNVGGDDNIHRENPDTEIEVVRSAHTSPQRLSMERQSSSCNTNLSTPDFSFAMLQCVDLSFESIRNLDNVIEASETPVIVDDFPRKSAMERNSINEHEKSRVGLKRAFSFPEDSTKIFKSENENAKQFKSAFVQTTHQTFLVNTFTKQTEQNSNINIGTQTTTNQGHSQVRSVQMQTEETATNNVGVQTEKANVVDSESQTDDFSNERWHRYYNYYQNGIINFQSPLHSTCIVN